MEENRMSTLGGSLLWFGAAISIAEIISGALLAPLGFAKGIIAIILGHLLGCVLFYFVGMIGAKSKKGAMESTGITFGRYGSLFFSVLNILQLIGWTAVMIISGAEAMNAATGSSYSFVWCVIIGLLIIMWILVGLKNISKINYVAVTALFVLSVVLGVVVFKGGTSTSLTETMSFGLALELSIAMPISWLPLISDYTKNTNTPVKFTAVSSISYFIGSCCMYIIGLGAALFAGTSDIVSILTASGLGIAAMIIVILSTVTTTFLDAYSAGESMVNIWGGLNPKLAGVIISIIGTGIAIFVPILQFENFLYLIGSVFVPMATIMIADYFIAKNKDSSVKINITNLLLWVVGFVVYRLFLGIDTVLGSTIPVVFIVLLLSIIANLIKKAVKKNVQ